jgi:hypothetical protein
MAGEKIFTEVLDQLGGVPILQDSVHALWLSDSAGQQVPQTIKKIQVQLHQPRARTDKWTSFKKERK